MALADQQHSVELSEAGWYPDPDQEHRLRYFNGAGWTAHVTHYGPAPCAGCFFTSLDG